MTAGSVYRRVALLTRAGILQVVAERRVRGTVERTYTLRMAAAQIQPGEARAMTLDEHAQAFMAYIAGLLGDFDRYLASAPPDPVADGPTTGSAPCTSPTASSRSCSGTCAGYSRRGWPTRQGPDGGAG